MQPDFHFKVEFATSKYMVKVLRGETNLMIWVRVRYLSQKQWHFNMAWRLLTQAYLYQFNYSLRRL